MTKKQPIEESKKNEIKLRNPIYPLTDRLSILFDGFQDWVMVGEDVPLVFLPWLFRNCTKFFENSLVCNLIKHNYEIVSKWTMFFGRWLNYLMDNPHLNNDKMVLNISEEFMWLKIKFHVPIIEFYKLVESKRYDVPIEIMEAYNKFCSEYSDFSREVKRYLEDVNKQLKGDIKIRHKQGAPQLEI